MITVPFSNIEHIAMVVRNLLPATMGASTYFSEDTFPTKATVERIQILKAAELQAALSEFGFVIPLTAPDGEEWIEYQTYVLEACETKGVLHNISRSLQPAPATPSVTTSETKHWDEWIGLLRHARATGLGLRALYRYGTPAAAWMTEPGVPTTNLIEHREQQATYEEATLVSDTLALLDEYAYRGLIRRWSNTEYDLN